MALLDRNAQREVKLVSGCFRALSQQRAFVQSGRLLACCCLFAAVLFGPSLLVGCGGASKLEIVQDVNPVPHVSVTGEATAAPDDLPLAPPLSGIQLGESGAVAHAALVRTYRQARWSSEQPVLVRRYEVRDPTSPFSQVVLETCQTDGAVIAVRVLGNDARSFYEAAHQKFIFRFVERAQDVPHIVPGMDPGPGMSFTRQYAEGVWLHLVTTAHGAELLLESAPLRRQCEAAFGESKKRMKEFFNAQDLAKKEHKRGAL